MSADTLTQIRNLAASLVAQESRVTRLTQELTAAKDEFRKLSEEDLPELMREVGLSELKLDDGSAIKVVDECDCAITEARRPAAHAWLVSHGFGGLIKSEITVQYEREERDKAVAAMVDVERITGHPAQLDEKVHPQTLKAFVREQRAAGTAIPEDLFSLRPYSKAKLTAAKK